MSQQKDFDYESMEFRVDREVNSLVTKEAKKKGPVSISQATSSKPVEKKASAPKASPYESSFNSGSSLASTGITHDLVFFQIGTQFFTQAIREMALQLPHEVISDLTELSRYLKHHPKSAVFFYYDDNAKVSKQLIPQLRRKFPKVKTVLVYKKMSSADQQAHQSSDQAANLYLSYPFSLAELAVKVA